MRIDVKTNIKKKEDGVGVGFLIAFAVLCGVAYVASAPDYAAMFPHNIERALTSYRTQIETVASDVHRNVSTTYATIAGR